MTAAVLPLVPCLDTPRRAFIAVAVPYVLAANTSILFLLNIRRIGERAGRLA